MGRESTLLRHEVMVLLRAGPLRLAAMLALVFALLLAGRAFGGERGADRAADHPPDVAGTYRMAGTVRLAPGALPARELDARGDAVLERGAKGVLRARLAARGQRCDLEGRLAAGGALSFAPGQVCRVVLDGEEARGTVEATLERGSGRAAAGLLAVDLTFKLDGAVRLRPASFEVLGAAFGGGGWLPEMPVKGDASARAEGRRDESRAVGR
jgi:hypothetical protein